MRKWIPLFVIIVAFIASAAVYQDLSERMPTHWNMSGEVDGWTRLPWGAFVIPLMLLVGLAMFHLLPKIDPRGANLDRTGSWEYGRRGHCRATGYGNARTGSADACSSRQALSCSWRRSFFPRSRTRS